MRKFVIIVIFLVIILTASALSFYSGYKEGIEYGVARERNEAMHEGVGRYQKNIIDDKMYFRYGCFND